MFHTPPCRLLTAAILAAAVTFAAPGAQARETLRMSTLGLGTSPYVVLSTFANVINDELDDVQIRVNSTGAATQHMVQAAEGRLDLYTMSPTMFRALANQQAMFEAVENAADLSEELCVIFNFPAGVYQMVTYADSGIETLEDLEGKSVFLGPPGGATTQVMMNLVEGATGLVANDDYKVVQLGWNAGHQAFQDHQIDVAVFLGNLPTSAVSQLALTNEIRILGLEPRHLEGGSGLLSAAIDRPGGITVDVPVGLYGDGQVNTEPATSAAVIVGLATRKSLDEDLVYRLTKTWWENLSTAHQAAPWMSNVTLEGATMELNAPLHPGAARYYREIGVELPDAVE